ncbi:MAG: C4-type zinc ribbon domain-containing protein [Desulfobacteraceae bacterium]|nr:C4-type zinc ribbon domain-containing protein [Desulfobacteraceae bacterium]
MKEAIKNLMDLQAIDLEVQKIDERMADGHEELEKKRRQIEQNQAAIADYQEQFELGEKRRRELEATLADEGERLKDRQAKLMSIQTNREYQSILKEIEDTKTLTQQREEELSLLLEQSELIQKKIEELGQRCAEQEQELEADAKRVSEEARRLEADKREITVSRDTQAKKVDSKYLSRYEMLRAKRNGLAVTGVTRGVCRGCNMNIPPQMFNQLLREQELLTCPTCNRMMYHQPETEER